MYCVNDQLTCMLDDIILLADSNADFQTMLDCACEYAHKWRNLYNLPKCIRSFVFDESFKTRLNMHNFLLVLEQI